MRGRVVEGPPVGLLHVLLGDLARLGVHVDEHLGAGPQEARPDGAALLGHVHLRQLLHPPHRLHEQQVLRRVLLLQERAAVGRGDFEQTW